ncbi:MAG TPA: hypothetical protein VFU43_13610 [Streptosporangiaceae bacterium]|nr:hypothetical protein [Streptosporangiaceae bacterium]
MRKLHAMLTAVAAATLVVGGASAANAAGPEQGKPQSNQAKIGVASTTANDALGCPSGYVCLIASDGTIVNRYYYYGTYNLSGKHGYWIVDNNQTGGAHVDLCYNYGGTNCFAGPPAGYYAWYNLTPINSIKLRA